MPKTPRIREEMQRLGFKSLTLRGIAVNLEHLETKHHLESGSS